MCKHHLEKKKKGQPKNTTPNQKPRTRKPTFSLPEIRKFAVRQCLLHLQVLPAKGVLF